MIEMLDPSALSPSDIRAILWLPAGGSWRRAPSYEDDEELRNALGMLWADSARDRSNFVESKGGEEMSKVYRLTPAGQEVAAKLRKRIEEEG